jgi:hypothetical protein
MKRSMEDSFKQMNMAFDLKNIGKMVLMDLGIACVQKLDPTDTFGGVTTHILSSTQE